MHKIPLVSNTTLLLYLGRLGHAQLLPALFAPIYIPEQVVLELDAGRLLRPDTINPRELEWATIIQVRDEEIGALAWLSSAHRLVSRSIATGRGA